MNAPDVPFRLPGDFSGIVLTRLRGSGSNRKVYEAKWDRAPRTPLIVELLADWLPGSSNTDTDRFVIDLRDSNEWKQRLAPVDGMLPLCAVVTKLPAVVPTGGAQIRLRSFCGIGGMGQVWLAEVGTQGASSFKAVKFLTPPNHLTYLVDASQRHDLEQHLQEVRNAVEACATSPFFVRTELSALDLSSHIQLGWPPLGYIMDYYPVSLHDFISECCELGIRISPAVANRWCTQLIRGLKTLHTSLKKAHRDLKASNILLHLPGIDASTWTEQIRADGGLLRSSNALISDPGTFATIGELPSIWLDAENDAWKPPEIRGEQPPVVTAKEDMFALGRVFQALAEIVEGDSAWLRNTAGLLTTSQPEHRPDADDFLLQKLDLQRPKHLTEFENSLVDSGYDTEQHRRFIGRDHIFREFDRFRDHCESDDHGGHFIIQGEAGIGKTALLTEWNRRNQGQYPAFFFRYTRRTRPVDMTRALAFQLSRRYDIPFDEPDINDDGAWPGRLKTLLRNIAEKAGPGVFLPVFIDGLDEADDPAQAVMLLPDGPLPSGVFFVLSSRPPKGDRDHLARLRGHGVRRVALLGTTPENLADAESFVKDRFLPLTDAHHQQLQPNDSRRLAELAGGSFLLLSLWQWAVKSFEVTFDELLSRKGSVTLFEWYQEQWERLTESKTEPEREDLRSFAALLSVVQAPATEEHLCSWLGWDDHRHSKALREFRWFIHLESSGVTDSSNPKIAWRHKSIADFFLHPDSGPAYRLSHRMHARIGEYYVDQASAVRWSAVDVYGLRFCTLHLERGECRERLFQILSGREFISAQLDRFSDYRLTHEALMAGIRTWSSSALDTPEADDRFAQLALRAYSLVHRFRDGVADVIRRAETSDPITSLKKLQFSSNRDYFRAILSLLWIESRQPSPKTPEFVSALMDDFTTRFPTNGPDFEWHQVVPEELVRLWAEDVARILSSSQIKTVLSTDPVARVDLIIAGMTNSRHGQGIDEETLNLILSTRREGFDDKLVDALLKAAERSAEQEDWATATMVISRTYELIEKHPECWGTSPLITMLPRLAMNLAAQDEAEYAGIFDLAAEMFDGDSEKARTLERIADLLIDYPRVAADDSFVNRLLKSAIETKGSPHKAVAVSSIVRLITIRNPFLIATEFLESIEDPESQFFALEGVIRGHMRDFRPQDASAFIKVFAEYDTSSQVAFGQVRARVVQAAIDHFSPFEAMAVLLALHRGIAQKSQCDLFGNILCSFASEGMFDEMTEVRNGFDLELDDVGQLVPLAASVARAGNAQLAYEIADSLATAEARCSALAQIAQAFADIEERQMAEQFLNALQVPLAAVADRSVQIRVRLNCVEIYRRFEQFEMCNELLTAISHLFQSLQKADDRRELLHGFVAESVRTASLTCIARLLKEIPAREHQDCIATVCETMRTDGTRLDSLADLCTLLGIPSVNQQLDLIPTRQLVSIAASVHDDVAQEASANILNAIWDRILTVVDLEQRKQYANSFVTDLVDYGWTETAVHVLGKLPADDWWSGTVSRIVEQLKDHNSVNDRQLMILLEATLGAKGYQKVSSLKRLIGIATQCQPCAESFWKQVDEFIRNEEDGSDKRALIDSLAQGYVRIGRTEDAVALYLEGQGQPIEFAEYLLTNDKVTEACRVLDYATGSLMPPGKNEVGISSHLRISKLEAKAGRHEQSGRLNELCIQAINAFASSNPKKYRAILAMADKARASGNFNEACRLEEDALTAVEELDLSYLKLGGIESCVNAVFREENRQLSLRSYSGYSSRSLDEIPIEEHISIEDRARKAHYLKRALSIVHDQLANEEQYESIEKLAPYLAMLGNEKDAFVLASMIPPESGHHRRSDAEKAIIEVILLLLSPGDYERVATLAASLESQSARDDALEQICWQALRREDDPGVAMTYAQQIESLDTATPIFAHCARKFADQQQWNPALNSLACLGRHDEPFVTISYVFERFIDHGQTEKVLDFLAMHRFCDSELQEEGVYVFQMLLSRYKTRQPGLANQRLISLLKGSVLLAPFDPSIFVWGTTSLAKHRLATGCQGHFEVIYRRFTDEFALAPLVSGSDPP